MGSFYNLAPRRVADFYIKSYGHEASKYARIQLDAATMLDDAEDQQLWRDVIMSIGLTQATRTPAPGRANVIDLPDSTGN